MAFWKRGKDTHTPNVSASRPSLIQALEPRMMFDASVGVVADQGAQAVEAAAAATGGKDTSAASDAASTRDNTAHEPAHQATPATAPISQAPGNHEVVFVDSAVSDYQKLIAGLPAGVEVVVLDNGKDGFKQIADYLNGRSDVTSVDIISHGDSGYVYLAGNAIWANQLASHGADLARIGASLAPGGDIRFFACNTGAGSDGQLFVNEVARLSGADVGASSDSTGNRAGEDWELETISGAVATGVGVQRGDLSAFNTSLATITVTSKNASLITNDGQVSLAEAIQAANTDTSVDGSAAGSGNDIIVFHQNLKGEIIRWSSATALVVTSNITINGDVDGDGKSDIILSGDVNSNNIRDAGEASGLQSNGSGVLTVRNLDMRHFSSNITGGAIRANGGSITVEDSNFQDNAGTVINSATTTGSTVVIRNTTIHDNNASIVGATGMSSLVRLGGNNNHVLENVAIYNNSGTYAATATVAGASVIVLSNSGGSVTIVNSTIANNTYLNTSSGTINSAGLGWATGGAGTVTVLNSIISGNTVNGAALDAATNSGSGGGYTSTTNLIGTTVNFVNAAGGDYRLASTASNAIDQGTQAGAPATDLRGFDRPRGGGVDIGAYEVLYSAPPLVDLDTGTGGNDSTVNFAGSPVVIVPNISISQSDGDTQVSGATLTLGGVLDGGSETLSLTAGQIATAASFGITIGGSGTAVLSLSGVATLAQYRAVLAAVTYGNAAGAYTSGTRSVTVSINDDMGSTTRTASVVVQPPNAAPVIANLNGDSQTFTQGSGAVLLDSGSNATVTDSDSADFAGGNLTVAVSGNGVAGEDLLGIRNQGTGAGQIGVSGNTVSYGGVAIGTYTGGTGGANLVLTFNGNATAAAVQAVVRNLTYDNSNAANSIGQATRTLSVTINDGDGATSSAASVTVAIHETVPPTATISLSDTALKVGETATVTITFSEVVSGFTNTDLTVTNGTLSAVSSSDGGKTWTATFTPTSNITSASNVITLNNAGVTDLAGNAGAGTTSSANYSIDTQRPTATIVVADSNLSIGETSQVTITFSEAVTGFTSADLTVANGTLSAVTSSDGGMTWTATFTPTSAITDATNLITLDNTGVSDAAGNAGSGTTNSNNYAIDTQRPTATIVVADSNLSIGETSQVTITFSEAVTGFTNADLTVANGTLGAVSSSDGGITWTATFTPNSSITDATNVITLDNTGVSDAAGNAGSGTTNSNNYAIDTVRPTATIVVANPTLAIGQTSLVTFTFSEAVIGFSNADVTVANGNLSAVSSSDGGITWTATFTPSSNITDTSNLITLDNSGVADLAGNAGSGTTDSNNYTIDTQRPTATIVVADNNLTVGETTTVTITFSEAVTGFTLADLTAPNGNLSGLSSSDGGITWTATFTPSVNVQDATNVIALSNSGVADLAGNAGSGTTNSNNYGVSTLQPTATVVVSDAALRIGETSLVTITFSEAVTGFTNADLTVANGTLSAVSSADGGITWTATFTPTSNIQDATNLITLDNSGVVGASSGNAGSGTTDSNNYAIDTQRPTATIVVADSSLAIGETSLVTITFSEAVTGFSSADLTVANGTLSAVSSADGGITWTATLTPTAGITDTSNLITLDNSGVTDTAGNAGSGSTDSNNYAIDSQRPTATIVIADPTLTAGETTTVTFTFSEAVTGFSNADLTIANGTLSAVSSSDGGITWTATFTPNAGVRDLSNLITLNNTGISDLAGNAGVGTTSSANYTVDTVVPTATIVVADSALRVGETSLVTITFSEAVTGFSNADLTLGNGTLSAVSSSDGGITWTATFTPTSNITDSSNLITLDNSGVVGASSGNAGVGTTDSNNYAIDTQRPTATIVVADSSLAIGETSLVTITFSEAVSGFTTADLTVANGTLSGLSSSDGGITWTATLTPTAGITDTSNLITLDNSGVTDAAGNAGSGTTDSNNYAVDSQRPTATIVMADSDLRVGETSLVTITFSEAVTGFSNADLSVANGTLSALSSADGGITWTAIFTPSNGVQDGTNLIVLNNTGYTDLAGNSGTGTTSSANYTVSTVVPTATVVVADTALRAGESSLVTITFSEAVSGFTLADLMVANGTLSGLSSSDGGITWTATLTPGNGVEDTSNLITLDNSGVVAASSGNAGVGSTDSNNYAIDTRVPSVTSVGGPAGVSYNAGDALVFVVNASEAVQVTGAPRLALDIGGHTVFAELVAGAGTSTLVFQYLVQAGDNDADGITVTGLAANGATLVDAAGNAMDLTLNGVADTHQVLVDTQAPSAVGIVTLDPSPSNAQSVRFTVTFNEQVNGVDLGDFSLVGTGSASGTLSGLQALGGGVYVITVSGVHGTGTLGLNLNGSATGITDVAGNALVGGLTGATYNIDRDAPTVSSVGVPVGVPYNTGDVLTFVVNTSEAVLVDGVPRLALDVGGRTVYADFVAGSGTPTLVFQYQIQAGDNDADGIQVLGLSANGASLHDAAGNQLTPGLNNIGDSHGVIVDGTPPSVVSIVANPSPTPGSQSFTVTFSEDVSGVGLGDFELLASGNASGTLQSLVRLDGHTWQVNVAGVAGSGGLALGLKASGTGIRDGAGNALVGGFAGQSVTLQSTDGDPEFRAYPPARPGQASPGTPVVIAPLPVTAPFQSPLLPQPLFEVPTTGGGLPTLGNLFIQNGALAPSYLAQVFAGQHADSGIGNGSGAGFLGFGGGDANVFGASSLANIFDKTLLDDGGQYELSGGKPFRQGAEAGAGKGLTGAPTLGQQLQAFREGEQHQARQLAQALGQVEVPVPQA
ncbi:Ig-like domain-containing protein [Pseudomonas sp. CCOS 191]|uniref:Ig-like domain-containing protein n=1 Tax=Pseudomonas sp. CCOS 191 TaxID=1649877 RepID=UPI00062455AC|nr:Ig-like domain-containing protein [Pseudomonas sp. CCOS 191]CRI59231.1 Pyrrolo-quinoline quinone [Pseudomonas sp. CCOS 191]